MNIFMHLPLSLVYNPGQHHTLRYLEHAMTQNVDANFKCICYQNHTINVKITTINLITCIGKQKPACFDVS